MTVIAAYIDGSGNTAIGADRAAWSGSFYYPVTSKLRRWGPWTVGLCGPSLWHRFVESYQPTDFTPEAFADTWLAWARERGHGRTDEDGHHSVQGDMLLARHSEIVAIGSDGAVIRPEGRYFAIGSGGAVAMGALAAMAGLRRPPVFDELVERAVHAACAHASGCGGAPEVLICDPALGLPRHPTESHVPR